jgi:integrase/recombinase XerC
MSNLTTAPPVWKPLLRDFQRALQAENKSPRTVRTYVDAALRVAHRYPDVDPTEDLERRHLREHIALLIEETSASNAHTHQRALQQYFNFLVLEGEIEVSPLVGMKLPIIPEKPVPVVQPEAVTRVLATCKGKGFVDRRDEALLRTFFTTGVRLTEIVVDVDAIDLDVDTIGVLGKGRKLRTVPFPPTTGRAISRYLRVRAKHRQAYRPELWLAERGRNPLTANGIAQIIRRRGQLAGIGDDIGRSFHAHLARHTFSHEFLAAGGSESDLMLLMGWSSPTMPRRYGKSAATERAHAAARKMRVGDQY